MEYDEDKYWSDDEDIKNDILKVSDFCKFPQPTPEPSEFMKKLRGKPSIFEDDPLDDEPQPEAQCLPIRGHPLLRETIRRPGGQPSFNQRETSALIREVSGFGYGNDLIEHAFKASNSEDEKDPKKMKNLEFNSPSHRKSDKKNNEESDSSASTSSEYIAYSSRSSSNGNINGFDIYSKKEFPELQ